MLLREAQAMARLSHPNVVAVHEVGVVAGAVFVAMEYVEGVDLQEWLAAEERPWRELVAALREAGRGLITAHQEGLVHRDFKPSNVLVGDDGRIRVADFGLATRREGALPRHAAGSAQLSSSTAQTLTHDHALVGTPLYMAPELLKGQSASPASDQYAFCVALYEALYDAVPFSGETLDELTRSVLADPVPPRPPGSPVPEWIHSALVRGLARAPEDRFASMEELVELLGEDPEAEQALRARRTRTVVGIIVGTMALLIIVIAAYAAIRRYVREQAANTRLERLGAELESLRAAGEHGDALPLLEAFVALPENRGLAVVARAYLLWADSLDDDAAAIDAYASAYVSARRRAEEVAALRGLILRMRNLGLTGQAAAALRVLEQLDAEAAASGALRPIRLAAALAHRDLPGAAALLTDDEALADPRWREILTRLASTTPLSDPSFARSRPIPAEVQLLDTDGDGVHEFATRPAGQPLRLFTGTSTPRLLLEVDIGEPRRFQHLEPLVQGEPLALATYSTENPAIYRVHLLTYDERGAVRVLDAWDDSSMTSGLRADLDRDGELEIYVISQAYTRRFWRIDREADGRWSRKVAHRPTDSSRSDLTHITVADLDDDGEDELVVAAGPWKAYDLRVFEPLEERALDLVARRSFGSFNSLATIRKEGPDLLAFVKTNEQISPGRFPATSPQGEPAGLYIVGLEGRTLGTHAYTPGESELSADGVTSTPPLQLTGAGDLDGDGQDELVLWTRHRGMILLRWSEGRPLDTLTIGGLIPLLVADIDGDGRADILARITGEGDPRVVLLGIGDVPLPPLGEAELEPQPVPEEVVDPSLAAAWRHAEQLVAIGVPKRSAAELSTIGRFSGEPGTPMLMRAGEIYAEVGEDRLAAENYLAAATRPSIASKALAGAASAKRRLGELTEALDLTRRRFPFADGGERAAIEAEESLYAAATGPRPELEFTFDGVLAPEWRIFDPVAIQRDLGERALSMWADGNQRLASYPLTWDGGPVSLEVELEIDRLEWGTGLVVNITDDERTWLSVKVGGYGTVSAPYNQADIAINGAVSLSVGVSSTLRARVEVYPGLETVTTQLWVDGEERPLSVRARDPRPEPGPLTLALSSVSTDPHFVGHARLRSIRTRGFQAGEAAEEGAPAARMIVEHRLAEALQALESAPSESPQGLWRIDLLLSSGAIQEAAVAISELLAAHPPGAPLYNALYQRLRRGDMAAWLAAKEAFGPRLVDLMLTNDIFWLRPEDVEWALRLLDPAPPLTSEAPLSPRTEEARSTKGRDAARERAREENPDPLVLEQQRYVLLDLTRALALIRAGHHGAAQDALDRAYARLSEELPAYERLRPRILMQQLSLAVLRGEIEAAQRWIMLLLRESPTPYLELELMRARETLTEIVPPETWEAIERELQASRP